MPEPSFFGGPKECLVHINGNWRLVGPNQCFTPSNIHFLVNLGLQKYKTTLLISPSTIQLHPLVVDFKGRL